MHSTAEVCVHGLKGHVIFVYFILIQVFYKRFENDRHNVCGIPCQLPEVTVIVSSLPVKRTLILCKCDTITLTGKTDFSSSLQGMGQHWSQGGQRNVLLPCQPLIRNGCDTLCPSDIKESLLIISGKGFLLDKKNSEKTAFIFCFAQGCAKRRCLAY